MYIEQEVSSKLNELKELRVLIGQRNLTEAENNRIKKISDEINIINTQLDAEYLQEKWERASKPRGGYLDLNSISSRGEYFDSLGHQLQAIFRTGKPGFEIDPKLYKVNTRAAAGMSELLPSDGGFLLESSYSNALLKELFETGKLAKFCFSITIPANSNSIKLPAIAETSRVTGSRFGALRGYWLNEAGTKIASSVKIRNMELSLKKLTGLLYATDELVSDTVTLEKIIRNSFNSEFGFLVDESLINGTGVGQPLGIMNAACLVNVTRNTANSVVIQDLTAMWSRMIDHSNAVWLCHSSVFPQLYEMSLTVGTTGGHSVFLKDQSIAGTQPITILGRPLIVCEQCQTLGTAGDLILANFKDGYILATKAGIEFAVSQHVRFTTDETTFRCVLRIDGQPFLNSVITPFHGTNTLSHFVALS